MQSSQVVIQVIQKANCRQLTRSEKENVFFTRLVSNHVVGRCTRVLQENLESKQLKTALNPVLGSEA